MQSQQNFKIMQKVCLSVNSLAAGNTAESEHSVTLCAARAVLWNNILVFEDVFEINFYYVSGLAVVLTLGNS